MKVDALFPKLFSIWREMKFIYVSRHFNKSGYYILKNILENSNYKPEAVLLPLDDNNNQSNNLESLNKEKMEYFRECEKYNATPLKFFESIKLLSEKYNIPVLHLKCIKTDEAYEAFVFI